MGQNEDYILEDSLSDALRNCSEEVSGEAGMYVILVKKDKDNQANILAEGSCESQEGYCWSRGAGVSINDFSAFIDMRKCKSWAHKNLLLKISI